MKAHNFYPLCKRLICASFLLIAALTSNPLLAQSKRAPVSGYGNASYIASQTGKFMKNWLIAGPVSVSSDTTNPDNTTQEKAFKEDIVSTVKAVNGKSVSPLQIRQKAIPWKMVASVEDAVMVDTAFGKKDIDFVYAYALAEIKAEKDGNVMLGVGSDDAIKIWLNGKLVHGNFVPRAR